MNSNEQFVMVSFHLFETHERERRREGKEREVCIQEQQTGVIETKPAVKIQSASASPGIAIEPRSVVQGPMPDDGSTVSGGVAAAVSRRLCRTAGSTDNRQFFHSKKYIPDNRLITYIGDQRRRKRVYVISVGHLEFP